MVTPPVDIDPAFVTISKVARVTAAEILLRLWISTNQTTTTRSWMEDEKRGEEVERKLMEW